jgi:hypothetical protein
MAGAFKLEALESVSGEDFVEEGTDLVTGLAPGVTLVQFTAKPGVRYAKVKITETGGGGPGLVSAIVGIM